MCKDLPAQRCSDLSELGAEGAMAPDFPASSSGVGPCEMALTGTTTNDQKQKRTNSRENMKIFTSGWDLEREHVRALEMVRSLKDQIPLTRRRDARSTIGMVIDCISELFSRVNRLEHARRYILARVDAQEKQIHILRSKLNAQHLELDSFGSFFVSQ